MRAAFFSALAASAALAAPAEEPPVAAEACTGPSYDFIVVGSGPGGGPLASNLARAGYKTLLMEAGDDESADVATQVAGLFASTGIHDNLHWDFWVRHYDDDEQTKKFAHLTWKLPNGDMWVGPGSDAPEGAEILGVNYPRGATLGGSSIINAGAVFLPPDSDWNYIADITGDKSWNAAHMRELFMKLEDNQYLPEGTPGHGFDGYLKTNIGTGDQFLSSEASVDVLEAIISELGKDPQRIKNIITEDANFLSPTRDQTDGLWALPFHSNKTWGRVSARNRILDTVKEKFPLELQLNSLATKVLFDKSGEVPKAVGIEFLEGKSVYKGDPRWDPSKKGAKKTVCAKKEVILSGGAYNSPQLLLLSGIGAKEHLEEHAIKVVVDLPGVGTNMQDNQEIGVFSLAAKDFYPAGDCTFGVLPDPCYDQWLKGEGPYTQAGPNSDIMLLTTSHAPKGEHRDITVFSGPFAFRGFWPATPNQTWVEPLNTWGMHMVKNFPQNRAGYVKLVSNDPTDMPEINFRLFTQHSETDISAMKEGIAFCRRALMRVGAPTGPMDITHPPCPAGVAKDGTCTDEDADEEWIRSDAFGHHVTSTNPIGADDDEMAVLDSNFNVRGTKGLRVVDASVFPRIPGSFPVVATFMVSEKASEIILSGLKAEASEAPKVEVEE